MLRLIPTVSLTLILTVISEFSHATSMSVLQSDLAKILRSGNLPSDLVQFDLNPSNDQNTIQTSCSGSKIFLRVSAKPEEQVSSFYYGLHKLGFLFPHPRKQMSPNIRQILSQCDKTFTWRPSIRKRGFHFHTQHPNEWVQGFYEGDAGIVEDSLFWLAHNFQNLLQIKLLKTDFEKNGKYLKKFYPLMHELGIEFGLTISFTEQQQHAYHLIPLFNALTGYRDKERLQESLAGLQVGYSFDYVSIDFGTSEFTSTDYSRTIQWMNTTCSVLKANGKNTFGVAHVSTGQVSPKYGNFNFLTEYADTCVGTQAHTVMFYALSDENTPVYGRRDFVDIRDYMVREKSRRETWYYPENSYFVGMDIDIPLLLTDYLVARAEDFKWVVQSGFEGHVTFSTGQELGYWLMDWNTALQASLDYLGDDLAAIKVLGEDPEVWRKILNFQTEFVKSGQLIQTISTSNLLDELFPRSKIHERTLLRELADRPPELSREIRALQTAIDQRPDLSGVRDFELKGLLEVTFLRIQHAMELRQALDSQGAMRNQWLQSAKGTREFAQAKINEILKLQRYPQTLVFEKRDNLTSYGYGYGWPAKTLFFWKREEEMVRREIFDPFYMNIYNPMKLIF